MPESIQSTSLNFNIFLMEDLFLVILKIMGLYFAVGLLFAIAFILKGLGKVDIAASDTGIVFKLLIVPGLMVLWPFFIYKWIKSTQR